MAKRKPAPRRSPRRQSKSSGMTTWIGVLALSVAGIWAYENRAQFFPQQREVASSRASSSSERQQAYQVPVRGPVPAKAPVAERNVEPKPQPKQQSTTAKSVAGPVPPVAIPASIDRAKAAPVVTAAIPANRPFEDVNRGVDNANIQPSEERVKPKVQQFSFCGRSGLKNCVEDGRVFWRDGKKQVLAGITVPRTDEAACVEERRRGFAAKVRLRDFLNAGEFAQVSQGNGLSLSRKGASFEQQLLREGLAMPAAQKNQSWCS